MDGSNEAGVSLVMSLAYLFQLISFAPVLILPVIFILLIPQIVFAWGKGCCSHNGGVVGCDYTGYTKCRNGGHGQADSCRCTPPKVKGCTDPAADNYNIEANVDNGSCKYSGCTDKNATNYDSKANKDDGSCKYIMGCMDKEATNYNSRATKDDGSCKYITYDL